MGLWFQALPEIVSVEGFGGSFGEDLGGELWFEKNERFWTNFFFGHSLAE
jgi:hypothetical protein